MTDNLCAMCGRSWAVIRVGDKGERLCTRCADLLVLAVEQRWVHNMIIFILISFPVLLVVLGYVL